jgi:signal transduction histidine kinase
VEAACDGPSILDGERMTRVMYNLIDNARKALIGCELRQLRLASRFEGDTLVITVADTGSGMDSVTLAHVFEPFYSASGQGGTGLGLLIVRNVIEAHGGTLAVESSPGQGTTVTIRIPRRV